MEQNDFYEVNGCSWFIPVDLIEENKCTKELEVVATESGRITFVPTMYKFRKPPEPQKVVVPKFVAEWIEEAKEGECSLCTAFGLVDGNDRAFNWLFRNGETNQDTFARAWLDGYEIEKERLYTVEIDGVSSGRLFKNIRTNKYLFHSGKGLKGYTDRLTETEIKQKDERLLQFAKEVE
ncbi:TPA: DUF1642 domain-containing protein [Streptococcus suis]|nr:DUF1642 domain-containing protein [Streptococcus suis]